MTGIEDGLVLRRARQQWDCEGDGSASHRHAPLCKGVIEPGRHYVECLWEAPAYSSGSRHSIYCARAFHGWPDPVEELTADVPLGAKLDPHDPYWKRG